MESPDAYQRILLDVAAHRPEVRAKLEALAAWLPFAFAQCALGPEALGADREKTGGAGRLTAIFTRFGSRLLDVDNLAGGFKALVDACRYEKLIEEDNPEAIDLIFRQKKVTRARMGTEIQILRF